MSAYLVDRGHIRFLVEAALMLRPESREDSGLRSYYHGQERHEVNELNADALGLMLWQECDKSVRYRYPRDNDDSLPGPIGDGPRLGYVHRHGYGMNINPLHVLSAIRCYEYQSCEHPGWQDSQARAFCRALQGLAISCLPGYDDAPWGAPKGWETEPPAVPARPRLVASR